MDVELGIPEFFKGESVFITGGTGFLGKVLIEKILRCCPEVKNIYVLIRPKRNKSIQDRAKKIFEYLLFDKLKKEQPSALDKLVALSGDVTQLGLGLSQEDRELLIENVGIVCHSAATVRFNQPLNEAIILNARGTREICKLCLDMKRLKVCVHVSTAYANLQGTIIKEEMYPAPMDWRKAIKIAEDFSKEQLNHLTALILDTYPNTYTFTKALAEHIVYDMLNDKVPNVIIRPTMIVPSVKDPMPGWLDNIYGPIAYMVAATTGLVRCFYTDNVKQDWIPVDTLIKFNLTAIWYKGTKSIDAKKTEVFHCGGKGFFNVSTKTMAEAGLKQILKNPMNKCFWYPTTKSTNIYFIYYFYSIFFHLLPGMVFDLVLKLVNKKPMVVDFQRQIFQSSIYLYPFFTQSWDFLNDKINSLQDDLLPKDVEAFGNACDPIDIDDYYGIMCPVAKEHFLKQHKSDEPKARRRLKVLYILHLLLRAAQIYVLYYVLFKKFDVMSYIL